MQMKPEIKEWLEKFQFRKSPINDSYYVYCTICIGSVALEKASTPQDLKDLILKQVEKSWEDENEHT